MIDPTLRQQVEQAAQLAAQRARQIDLVDWMARLKAAATSPFLSERLNLARSHRWAGAVPTWEPVDLAKETHANPIDVIGVDGSQIYPQDHGPVKWAYVQAVAYRKLIPPLFESRFVDIGTQLASARQSTIDLAKELIENRDELMALTNSWRTLLEMQLASYASEKNPGTLVLFDNGLLPWLSVSGQSAQKQLIEYLDHLRSIRPSWIAGIISGPQSSLLSRLVNLVEAETVDHGIHEQKEILDISLMRYHLRPGERSALFLHGSPRNQIFQDSGAGVFFFFLRINEEEIVRVEIPEWLALNPALVEIIHASVYADARITGYSYVLSQAHQHVIIPFDVANVLHSNGIACYWSVTGQVHSSSAKVRMKHS